MAKATRRTDGISFRNFDGAWYSSVSGKYLPLRDEGGNKIKGQEQEPEALRVYHLLKGEAIRQEQVDRAKVALHSMQIAAGVIPENTPAPLSRKAPTLGEVCDSYLDFLQRNRKASSYNNTKETLSLFSKFVGDGCKAGEVQRHKLKNWLASKTTWGNARQGSAIAHVVAAFNYAVETGAIQANQFNKFRKPVAKSRVVLLSSEQEQAVISVSKKGFADYFSFLILSGCRPDEGARVEAKNLIYTANGLQVVLQEHKTARKTGRPRIIYLCEQAAEIAKKWAAKYPQGPIFRRQNHQPWTDKARVAQWDRIRAKIQKANGKEFFGDDLVLYATRHTFATRKLAQGLPVATVAALCGNTPRMIESIYGHLSLCGNLLWAAIQGNHTGMAS